MREVTLNLKDHVYHRLEVHAARDDKRIEDGLATLVTYLVDAFDAAREAKSEQP